MSTGHHLFGPSAAHRWMVCAPSVAANIREGDKTSWEAAEGTVAHSMATTCLETGLDANQVWQSVEVATEGEHEIPITAEMREHVQAYIDYVRALGNGLQVEQRMVFPSDPDFGGTADALVWDIVANRLHVIDFKYGKGKFVRVEGNKQMLCYALLALITADGMFDVEEVVLHVHQPRIDNVASWTVPVADVVAFAKDVSKGITRARAAMKALEAGTPLDSLTFTPGDHCTFCAHAPNCKALREQAIVSAQEVFGDVTQVPTQTLGEILAKAELIDTWIGAVRQEAMDRAIRGEAIDGFKLVQKRAMRKWVDEQKVLERALDEMIDVYAPREVMSPPALEKVISKKALAATFGDLVQSVSSGLTLVAVNDPRQAVDPTTAAAEKAAVVFTSVA